MTDSGLSRVMFPAVQRVSKYIWLAFYLLLHSSYPFHMYAYVLYMYCICTVYELCKLGV